MFAAHNANMSSIERFEGVQNNDFHRQTTCHMQPREFDELYALEDTYWWFVGRRYLVHELIGRYAPACASDECLKILDAGCGTGGTIKAIDDLGETHGCDPEWIALQYCHKRGIKSLACGCVEQLCYVDESVDVVVSCDVLEHITDDIAALAEMRRVLKPGGILVATLPAHPFLWSEHDEALAHLRRYTRKEIVEKLQETGYKIEKLSAAVSFVFPAILAFRWLQRLRPKKPEAPKTDLRVLPGPLNLLLIALLNVEVWLMRYIQLPIGTSFALVARK
jgi:SAM-dependent methyltransferase